MDDCRLLYNFLPLLFIGCRVIDEDDAALDVVVVPLFAGSSNASCISAL